MVAAPLIPDTTLFSVNQTLLIKAGTLYSLIVTDGTATLSSGHLYNILNPVNLTDAVTKQYADVNVASSLPGSVYGTVQFNLNNLFMGSTSLTYNSTTSTLFATQCNVGSIDIEGGYIHGVIDPIDTTYAANKAFIDRQYIWTYLYINSTTGTTYTSMNKKIIFRDIYGINTSDTTDSAINIIKSDLNSDYFKLKNITSGTTGILTLTPGTGVTIDLNVNIYPGYEVNYLMSFTSATSLTMYPISYSFCNPQSSYSYSLYTLSENIIVNNSVSLNTNITSYAVQNVRYTGAMIGGIIYRNYPTLMTDTFSPVSYFISGYAFPNSPIDYVFNTGAVEFIIKNTSTSASLLLTSTTSDWIMDPNSNMTIGAGQTGYFYLYIDTVNLTGNVYTIGIN